MRINGGGFSAAVHEVSNTAVLEISITFFLFFKRAADWTSELLAYVCLERCVARSGSPGEPET